MTPINPMLAEKFKKKAVEFTNSMVRTELSDPMSVDYYKGYRNGLVDSPVFICDEAFALLEEALIHISREDIQEKIALFLRGQSSE